MNKNFRIGLDIDGVVADFGTHFLNYLDLEDKSPATEWTDSRFRENFHRVENDEYFWLTIPPIVTIRDLKFKPIIFVTARNIDSAITKKWLTTYGFGDIPLISVGMDKSKIESLKDKVDIFIDDAIHNFVELNNAGINCLLMTRAHNEHFNANNKRITNINDVIDYVYTVK